MADAQAGATGPPFGVVLRSNWWSVLRRVGEETDRDNLTIVAAGVAFYTLLASVPGMAALIALYGLVSDPADVQRQIAAFGTILPVEAQALISEQLTRIARSSSRTLGWGLLASFVLAIWSANRGMKTMIRALNITFARREHRGFIKLNAVSLLLTFGGVVFAALTLGLIVAVPALSAIPQLPDWVRTVLLWLRWPILAGAVIVALGVLYRYGPCRHRPRWRWLNPGAVTATLLWLLVSGLFSWYVSNFGSYNETYGSLGAVIILLMWLYLTAYAFLIGAELNVVLQTRSDAERPAAAAD